MKVSVIGRCLYIFSHIIAKIRNECCTESFYFFINYRSFFFSDPIDCDDVEDHCHLSWIIRHQSHLLRSIEWWEDDGTYTPAKCSNGTAFDDLNPDSFNQCPDQAPGRPICIY